jgi:hypothetical protein
MRIKEQRKTHSNKNLDAYGLKIDRKTSDGMDDTSLKKMTSQSFNNNEEGRLAVVLGYDERSGAHCLSYDASTPQLAAKDCETYSSAVTASGSSLDGVKDDEGNSKEDVVMTLKGQEYRRAALKHNPWIKLHLRDVIILDRVAPPQAAPLEMVDVEDEEKAEAEAKKLEEESNKLLEEKAAKRKLDDDDDDDEDDDDDVEKEQVPLSKLRQIILSGDCPSHEQYFGTFYEVSGRKVHDAPLFRTSPIIKAGGFRSTIVEHYFFKSSVSGMWVVTDLMSNFTENLGFLRTPPLGDDGMPCGPVQVFSGSFSGWKDEDSINVQVTNIDALPVCQWIDISSSSSDHVLIDNNKITRTASSENKTFVTSVPLGFGRLDVYGHNYKKDEKDGKEEGQNKKKNGDKSSLNHCRWFEIEIMTLKSVRRGLSSSDALRIGLVLSNPSTKTTVPTSSTSSDSSVSEEKAEETKTDVKEGKEEDVEEGKEEEKVEEEKEDSNETLEPIDLLSRSYMLCGKKIRANDQVIGSLEQGTESLTVGDRIRVQVKKNGTICYEMKKKGGQWYQLPITCDLNQITTPTSDHTSSSSSSSSSSVMTNLWGYVSLAGDVLEVKMIDVSGYRIIGEEGRYNIEDRNLMLSSASSSSPTSSSSSKKNDIRYARVERWLRGSIQLRSRPEFPGDSYRTMHTVSAGELFKFTETKQVYFTLVTSKSKSSKTSSKASSLSSLPQPSKKLPKMCITYYKLADGRGWVHDFDRDHISPRKPSISVVSNSIVGRRLSLKSNTNLKSYTTGEKINMVTVLFENDHDKTIDLVADDGQCYLNEPRSCVEEEEKKSRSPGAPSPSALQRTFSAVTTEQNPVSNGGFEFVRRETYRNVQEFLDKEEAVSSQSAQESVKSEDSSKQRLFPQLTVKFSVLPKTNIMKNKNKKRISKEKLDIKEKDAAKDIIGSLSDSAVELPSRSTLFQAIHKLQGSELLDDYFELFCTVSSVEDNSLKETSNSDQSILNEQSNVWVEESHETQLAKIGSEGFADSVKLLIILQRVLSEHIVSNPPLTAAASTSYSLKQETKEDVDDNNEILQKKKNNINFIRNQIGSLHFSDKVKEVAELLLSSPELWINGVLQAKLSSHLKPVAVVTGAVPEWIRWLPGLAPFLFSYKLRERMMKFMAFGISRGIVSLQEERYPVLALEREVASCYQLMTAASLEKAQRLEQAMQRTMEKHATSQLAKNNLKNVSVLPAWMLLREAIAIFSDARFLRSGSLEVTFRNETGFGTGVTAGFYSRIAEVLQLRAIGFGLAVVGVTPTSGSSRNEASLTWAQGSSRSLGLMLCAYDISVPGNVLDHSGHFKHAIWQVKHLQKNSQEQEEETTKNTSSSLSSNNQSELLVELSQNVWNDINGQKILALPESLNNDDDDDGDVNEGDDETSSFKLEYPLNGVLLPKPLVGSFRVKTPFSSPPSKTFELLYTEKKSTVLNDNNDDDDNKEAVSNGCDYLVKVLGEELGCLELWSGSHFERSQRTCKVKVLAVTQVNNNDDDRMVSLTVEGYIPTSWTKDDDDDDANLLKGAVFHALNWVPDELKSVDPHGSLLSKHGLFPAPLPFGVDPWPVLRHFRFLGRLFGKALVDGYLVPVRLHPAFFALVKSLPIDAAAYLPCETSHLTGDMRASHVAKLFSLYPQVQALQQLEDTERQRGMKDLLSCSYYFTGGLTLKGWLELLSFSEPITKTVIPSPISKEGVTTLDIDWDSVIDESNLYAYMVMLEDLWLGTGVQRQARAFRDGLSDMADVNAGSLAFGAVELRNLLCGPDTVEWSFDSLKKILRAKGDFVIRASEVVQSEDGDVIDVPKDGKIDTLDWLREALVSLDQSQRLKFMELTTGLRLLTPDKVITVRKTSERWPFFHSCTNQLDLPRYNNPKKLKDALEEALANGSAGGFSELTRTHDN